MITQHKKELASRKFTGLLRIICKCGNRIKFVNFFTTGRDRAMFRDHFVKLRENDLKSTINFKAPTNLP